MSDQIRREWTAEELARFCQQYAQAKFGSPDGELHSQMLEFLAEATRVWAIQYAYEQSLMASMRNLLPPLKG